MPFVKFVIVDESDVADNGVIDDHGPDELVLYSTLYPVMAVPPLFVGADHVTTSSVLPTVELKLATALGVVDGVAEIDVQGPGPFEFTAATWK